MLPVILASLLASPTIADARPLQWTLDCKWDMSSPQPIGAPRFQVQKTAFKNRSGKWDSKYAIIVRPLNPMAEPITLELKTAGSGDEDYNEYNVVAQNAPVQGAYIQNKFEWATVVDNEGYGSYRCE